MSKRTETAIKKVDPDFLLAHQEDDTSMAGMEEYRILARAKIIQGMTKMELKERFGEGCALIRPGDLVMCKPCKSGEKSTPEHHFLFVPLLFFAEYAKWADLRDTDGPMIIERSFDPASPLKDLADDPEKRFVTYEGEEGREKPKKYRYVHHLRFAGVIYGDHPLSGSPVVISFERGEYFNGTNFISAVRMRKRKVVRENEDDILAKVPLWAQVWKFSVGWRPRQEGGGWWGFNYAAPDEEESDSIISPAESEEMAKLHQEFAQLHERNRLRVKDDDRGDEETADVAATDAKAEF